MVFYILLWYNSPVTIQLNLILSQIDILTRFFDCLIWEMCWALEPKLKPSWLKKKTFSALKKRVFSNVSVIKLISLYRPLIRLSRISHVEGFLYRQLESWNSDRTYSCIIRELIVKRCLATFRLEITCIEAPSAKRLINAIMHAHRTPKIMVENHSPPIEVKLPPKFETAIFSKNMAFFCASTHTKWSSRCRRLCLHQIR